MGGEDGRPDRRKQGEVVGGDDHPFQKVERD